MCFYDGVSLIFIPLDKQNWANCMGGPDKNQTFMLFAIDRVWELLLEGFWGWNGSIFRSQFPFRSDFESKCYKYATQEGSGRPPIEIFSFEPQSERVTGRASQAEFNEYWCLTPRAIRIFRKNPLECIRSHQDLSESFRIHWNAEESIGIHLNPPESIGIH